MIASLHALSCDNDPCTCSPMYGWVRESEAAIERVCENTEVGDAWDQDASNVIAYTPIAPAAAADPSLRRGVVIRGSGE